ncbi:MAG: glycoside hydrolase family 20 zincin-like fold domain-containing protein [Armatimonadota bacterium]|nr:glycoside hydrolase family 20 zincin-like fold domain-containing protein [Armatimonadota bacterium]
MVALLRVAVAMAFAGSFLTAVAQPPTLQGEGWEAQVRNNGVQIRVAGVLLSRGSWVQIASPDWQTSYYSSQRTPPTAQRLNDSIQITHALAPERGLMRETLRLAAPNTLEWQLEVKWHADEPAIVEWCLGLWHAEYLIGATLAGEGTLATTQLSQKPTTLANELLFSGNRLAVRSRLVHLKLEGDTLSVLDGRGSARFWAREVPTLWVGVPRYALAAGHRVQLTVRLCIQPQPLPALEGTLTLNAPVHSVPDCWLPTPHEPELVPPPKIIWREAGVPFRLPTGQPARIHLEDETYRPAGEALARELQRYGISATIQVAPPEANSIFIGGSPALQRAHPVPDQQGAYYLEVREHGIRIIGRLQEGAFYGVQTLSQWFQPTVGALQASPVRIVDYPHLKWRGVHLFGSTQPDFLPRLIANVIAHAKFNHLVLECGYGQWEAIREAWVDISAPKPLLAEAVATARRCQIEPIPLIQSLGHMGWAFRNGANRELAEDPETPWAIAPRLLEARAFLRRLYDEVFALFQPRAFHIGLDEVTMRGRFPYRPESQGATVAELFVEHAEWLYGELKRRGVDKVLMWGDMLLARGEAHDDAAHAQSPEAARFTRERLRALPDLVICDWHYTPTTPENYISVSTLQQAGFANLIATTWHNPHNIASFAKAARQRRILGLLQTTWAGYSLNERVLQGNELRQFVAYLIAATYAWDADLPMPEQLPYDFERLFLERYHAEPVALQPRAGFVVDLSGAYNYDLTRLSPLFERLPSGFARLRGHRFQLSRARGVMLASYLAEAMLPKEVRIALNRPVQRLYLLHTTGWQTEVGKEVGRMVLEYADGTQVEQPIVYGLHVRAWNDPLYALQGLPLWRMRGAEGEQATVRLLSWRNPHPERLIRAIRFAASDPIAGWILLGLSGE